MYWWYVEFVPGKFVQLAVARTQEGAADLVLTEAGISSTGKNNVRVLQLGPYEEDDEYPPYLPASAFQLKEVVIVEDDS